VTLPEKNMPSNKVRGRAHSWRRAGLALACGVLTGSYIWALLTASGLSALIRTYGEAIVVLKISGCLL